MAGKRNIESRKKLSALYARGTRVRFGPEGGREVDDKADPPGEDEIDVWVQPPSPLQREMALRDAQAARAVAVLKAKSDQNSSEWLNAKVFVADMDDATLVDYLLTVDQDERQRDAMRDVLSAKEWEDFSDLQDAMRKFDEEGGDEEDPEWKPLLERDAEFGRQVNERFLELTTAARELLETLPREKWEKKALNRRSEMLASQTFMKAYEREMLFYACRDPENHDDLYWDNTKELLEQPDQVYIALSDALAKYITDGGQAKNSQGAAPGSESSVPPAEPETSEASTPEEPSE